MNSEESNKREGNTPPERAHDSRAKRIWQRIVAFVRWILGQLKDRKNIVIFLIVFVVMSSEIWVPYLLAILTRNPWWWAIGSACWAFWIAPFTPFFPICIAVTIATRKILDRIARKKKR